MPAPRESMVRRARSDTTVVFKERPVWFYLSVPLLGAPAGAIAVLVSVDHWSVLAKVALGIFAAGLGGAVLMVVVVFVAKLMTAKRHQLEDRVADLEEVQGEQREQVLQLTEAQFGGRDRFVPAYQDIRAELGTGMQRIDKAIESGQMWSGFEQLPVASWKKNQEALRTHLYAQQDDVYGVCAQAYGLVVQINSVPRIRRRPVQANDGLAEARTAMAAACERLDTLIKKARPVQP